MNAGPARQAGRSAITWIIVLGLAALTAMFYFRSRQAPVEQPPPGAEAPPPAVVERGEVVRHPLPEARPLSSAAAPAVVFPDPLPALERSDAALLGVIDRLFDLPEIGVLLVPRDVIRRIVVTVDSLPTRQVPLQHLPLRSPEAGFKVRPQSERYTIDPANAARYARYAALAQRLDTQRVVSLYIHFYPLFQQAYRDLGYSSGYFNDRLIVALDDLLATPEVREPIELIRPAVHYLYADPALEGRSAGQRLLLRMGRDNAAPIKARLREIRSALAG